MADFLIYTKFPCPYCDAAKAKLKELGHTYTEKSIAEPADFRALTERAPSVKTVPQIFFGDYRIGGFDDLQKLIRTGMLDDVISS